MIAVKCLTYLFSDAHNCAAWNLLFEDNDSSVSNVENAKNKIIRILNMIVGFLNSENYNFSVFEDDNFKGDNWIF